MRVGRGRVSERPATVLIHSPAPGVTERLFFDAETGLLLRRLTLTDTVLNPIPEQIDYDDYSEVDGIKVPFTIIISNIDTYYQLHAQVHRHQAQRRRGRRTVPDAGGNSRR